MSEFENPEFWAGIAFFLVVSVSIRPAFRKFKIWGQKQAESIKKELNEAHALRKQAEDLYAKYEKHTQNLEQERAEILQSAEKEVLSLQQESDEKLSNRLEKKKREVQNRIQLIQDNTHKDLTNKILYQVIEKTKEILSERPIRQTTDDMDNALEQVFKTLEKSKIKF